jgi:hypothetical protein
VSTCLWTRVLEVRNWCVCALGFKFKGFMLMGFRLSFHWL